MQTLAKICLAVILVLGVSQLFSEANSVSAQTGTKGKIAFIVAGSGGGDIFVLDLDTNTRTNITQGSLLGLAAFAWSPDGTQLVAAANRGSNLYVLNADGSGLRALTHNAGFAITQAPTWSPDGKRIAYVGNAEQNYDVFLIDADGTNQRRLTQNNAIYRDLAWSPDGTRIAYASGADFFNVKIFVMNADGSSPTQLSTGGGTDIAPAWSPDGSKIAYENDFQFGPSEIFVMNSDGSSQTRLTNNFRSDHHPTWSPDGSQIAFASDRDGTPALYSMNSDGSNPTRLTDSASSEAAPAWQPNKDITQASPTPTPSPTYSVSGQVVDLGGAPVGGVLVTFELNQSGTIQTKTTQTDAGGNYSSGELGCQNRVAVTPSKPGYTFEPQQINFVSTGCNYGTGRANFVGTSDSTPRYTISGRVTDGSGNGIGGATVTLSGTRSGGTQSDADGRYSFAGLPAGGSYTLSPTKSGQFVRFARQVTNLSGDLTVDLIMLPYVSVSARVTDASGNGVAGVSMRLGSETFGSPQTNPNGSVNISVTYSLSENRTVTLTPFKYGYTFNPPAVSFNTQSGNQVFNFVATLGNSIDDPQFFVRQHYADFLNREPDAEGLQFWTNQITSCGNDVGCIEVKRINVSGAYFLSIEFQETGYLVERFYVASYGRRPLYAEFLPDTRQVGQGVVLGAAGWEQQLESNKVAFVSAWVNREAFTSLYGGMSNAQYVDTLMANTGATFTQAERDALVTGLDNSTETRGSVLRKVAENPSFAQKEKSPAFVLMQYFGYLRRDPDAEGFNFWLTKLNSFGGNYQRAEMVKAFITSGEYRDRFVQP